MELEYNDSEINNENIEQSSNDDNKSNMKKTSSICGANPNNP